MGDDSVVGFVLLCQGLLHAQQYLLQALIALLHFCLLYCHFLEVNLIFLEVLEGLHQNPLTVFHLLAPFFGFDDAPLELSLALLCCLVLLFSLELPFFDLLFISRCLILLSFEFFSSGLQFLLADLELLSPLNYMNITSALTFPKSQSVWRSFYFSSYSSLSFSSPFLKFWNSDYKFEDFISFSLLLQAHFVFPSSIFCLSQPSKFSCCCNLCQSSSFSPTVVSASLLVFCNSCSNFSLSASQPLIFLFFASRSTLRSRMACLSSVILALLFLIFSIQSASIWDCSLSIFLFSRSSLTISRQRSSNLSYIYLQSCSSFRSSATVLSFSRVSTQEEERLQDGLRYFLRQNSSILYYKLRKKNKVYGIRYRSVCLVNSKLS